MGSGVDGKKRIRGVVIPAEKDESLDTDLKAAFVGTKT